MIKDFLPITKSEMQSRGIETLDFVYISGDAYVDHPSFCAAVISRTLDAAGYTVGIIPQPDWRTTADIEKLGRPRLGFLVSSGNMDSMVAHYTVSKKRRGYDYYSPGGKAGLRPDRAVIVYCNLIRQAFGDIPVIIGGIEASLRRFAHYDYWDNKVRRSILADSRADILVYGMGERALTQIAKLLADGVPVKKIREIKGTAVLTGREYIPKGEYKVSGDYNILKENKKAYADAFRLQYGENEYINGRPILEYYDNKVLVQNPPQPPLEERELDRVYSYPYMRAYHPSYEAAGGIPAINEVKFSITHNRGCFGGCSFCALAFHQGRSVRSRSIKSVVREAEIISSMPDFKGYIHDIGGPTANFRHPSCKDQLERGVCKNKNCLTPKPCEKLEVSHDEYMRLISEVEKLPGVKKVFIRSGIRFDYLIYDTDRRFFDKLVRDNISGQLKVAPEHISDNVLSYMGKPENGVYEKFCSAYGKACGEAGREQYLVPYLMSSHPGSTLSDAVGLALYLKEKNLSPEQVQDFYPTPGTISTCMFYTGLDPRTGESVYVPEAYEEKLMQRALLQPGKPENRELVYKALAAAGRGDLVGYDKRCLIRPPFGRKYKNNK